MKKITAVSLVMGFLIIVTRLESFVRILSNFSGMITFLLIFIAYSFITSIIVIIKTEGKRIIKEVGTLEEAIKNPGKLTPSIKFLDDMSRTSSLPVLLLIVSALLTIEGLMEKMWTSTILGLGLIAFTSIIWIDALEGKNG